MRYLLLMALVGCAERLEAGITAPAGGSAEEIPAEISVSGQSCWGSQCLIRPDEPPQSEGILIWDCEISGDGDCIELEEYDRGHEIYADHVLVWLSYWDGAEPEVIEVDLSDGPLPAPPPDAWATAISCEADPNIVCSPAGVQISSNSAEINLQAGDPFGVAIWLAD